MAIRKSKSGSFTVDVYDQKNKRIVKTFDKKSDANDLETKIKSEWSKEGKIGYEAGFKVERKNISVVLDKKGEIKETETSFPVSELRNSVAPFIEKNHAGFNITAAYKITDNKGKVTFETEIKKNKKTKELIFDQDGKHITK